MAQSALQQFIGGIGSFIESSIAALVDDAMRDTLIRDLGGTPQANSPKPSFPPNGLDSVKAYRDAAEPDLEALAAAIADIRSFFSILRNFIGSLDLGVGASVDEAYRGILDMLGWNVIRQRQPRLFYAMQLATFAEEVQSVYGGEFNGVSDLPEMIKRLGRFIFSPKSWFDQTNFNDENGVARIMDRTAMPITGLLVGLAQNDIDVLVDSAIYGWDRVPGMPEHPHPTADRMLASMLTLAFDIGADDAEPTPTDVDGNVNVSLALIPRTHGGPGAFLGVGGGFAVEKALGDRWFLSGEAQADGAFGLLYTKADGFDVALPSGSTDLHVSLALELREDPATGRAFDFSITKGADFYARAVRIELIVGTTGEKLTLKAGVRDAAFAIGPELFDGFLGRLIPDGGLRFDFDFAVGVGSSRGLFQQGQVRSFGRAGSPPPSSSPTPTALARSDSPSAAASAPFPPLPSLPASESTGPGFGMRVPIGRSLGPITLHDLLLKLGYSPNGPDPTFSLDVATSLSAKLGPVGIRVDRFGLRLALNIPDDPTNATLGLFDLDVGVLPPNGVGLAVDAQGILSGGGFLFYDKAKELYAGTMQLTLKGRITLRAFGLVTTRRPNGSKGYSVIIFITAEGFTPIPVGMACTLRGIGGMIAINRTFNVEAMREGLKNKTLGTLLFPKDPVRNAPEIIRNLLTIFPEEEGSHLVGLLLKFSWFSPPLVFLDLAVMLELGKRSRVIVLGRISSYLPNEKNDLVRLNMDALGILELVPMSVSIDAVLVDSRLAHKFVMTGAMALRLNTSGRERGFVMAVGGLNPRFVSPIPLPKLSRITIALSSGDNPRLTCEAYFAITSNTIQFGARAALYAAAYGFSIHGDVSFDVLAQLLPFHLIADFKASVQLKRGSSNLFKVTVEGSLEGPRPLRVSGKASFEIFWCDFSIRFDKTLVSGEKPPLPPAVDALAELKRALSARDSWSTQLPANRQHGVTLRKLAAGSGAIVLDPLGNLVVKQQVVPLNTAREIDTFGGSPVSGTRRFTVTATLNGSQQDVNTVRDAFAPAQFFSMSDDEKLSSPSFEEMDAGIAFGSEVVVTDAASAIASPFEFETIVIDEEGKSKPRTKKPDYRIESGQLNAQLHLTAISQAALRRAGLARFRIERAEPVATLKPLEWVVAKVEDTKAIAEMPSTSASWVDANAVLRELNASDRKARVWQLVPRFETVSS